MEDHHPLIVVMDAPVAADLAQGLVPDLAPDPVLEGVVAPVLAADLTAEAVPVLIARAPEENLAPGANLHAAELIADRDLVLGLNKVLVYLKHIESNLGRR